MQDPRILAIDNLITNLTHLKRSLNDVGRLKLVNDHIDKFKVAFKGNGYQLFVSEAFLDLNSIEKEFKQVGLPPFSIITSNPNDIGPGPLAILFNGNTRFQLAKNLFPPQVQREDVIYIAIHITNVFPGNIFPSEIIGFSLLSAPSFKQGPKVLDLSNPWNTTSLSRLALALK